MNLLIGVLVFCFGSLIGSFLNVCIYRIPNEESVSFPPSHCGVCGNFLKARDLVPIVSYLFLKGKCRYCSEKVSKQYPIIEGITGIIFVLLYIKFGFQLEFFKYTILLALLIVIGIIDLKTQYIYTNTIVFGIVTSVIFIGIEYFFYRTVIIEDYILGGILVALILGAVVLLTRAMGWGDVELTFMIGMFIGLKLSIFNLFISIILGGVTAIILLVFKIKERGDSIAFGPYISMAAIISILFGNEIINWYFNLLL